MKGTNQSRPTIGVEGSPTVTYEIVFGHHRYDKRTGEGALKAMRHYFEAEIKELSIVPKFDSSQLGSGYLYITLPAVDGLDKYIAEVDTMLRTKLSRKGVEIKKFGRSG